MNRLKGQKSKVSILKCHLFAKKKEAQGAFVAPGEVVEATFLCRI